MSLLTVEGLKKSYKSLQVLKDVSLEVGESERLVIIGPNGAGKTTLFNCLTGVVPIDSGMVTLGGYEIGKLPVHKRVSLGMSRTFQKNNLMDSLTLEENVRLAVAAGKSYRYQVLKPLTSYREVREETEDLLERWNLSDKRSLIVGQMSYGEQRLLEVVLAMASRPRILLLDEPTSGMSPAETAQMAKMIQNLPRSMSLLVIEHDMDVVFSIADRIVVLHHGEVLLSGTPDEVRNDERVRGIYFGGGAKQYAEA